MLSVILFTVLLGECLSVQNHGIQFSDQYITLGELSLPYVEIVEPFMAYYDGPNHRSRIDFYDGQVKTFQRSDLEKYGVSFKIAPMTTEEVTNKISCFVVNGSSEAPVKPQNILPDISNFNFLGIVDCSGQTCQKLQLVEMKGWKKNTYTMYVDNDNHKPIRYEMFGFDTLIGSHYDKYYIDYKQFTSMPPDPDSFIVPNNGTCGGFPGPGVEQTIEMNPILEFVHYDDTHVHPMFKHFMDKHRKIYSSNHEHQTRKHNFQQNLRFIQSKNRAGLSYRLDKNHLMDRSVYELRRLRGYRYSPGSHGGLPFDASKYKDTPETVDWRLKGAVTPVKDQAVCGSCWSFGTTGTIEGAYFIKTGQRLRLSQQELMDCSWGEGNNACDGGEDFRAYNWIMKHGLSTEDAYGPYLGQDGYCHHNDSSARVHMTGYVNVTTYNVDALKAAIANHGPVSIGIDASHLSLSFYSHGVYYEPKCGNKPDQLDHAVLAVGYGTMKGQGYWLVKNSWSTYWGNDGYVLMSQKDNNCGVLTNPTFPIVA